MELNFKAKNKPKVNRVLQNNAIQIKYKTLKCIVFFLMWSHTFTTKVNKSNIQTVHHSRWCQRIWVAWGGGFLKLGERCNQILILSFRSLSCIWPKKEGEMFIIQSILVVNFRVVYMDTGLLSTSLSVSIFCPSQCHNYSVPMYE